MKRKDFVPPLTGFISIIFCFISIACLFLKAWIMYWISLILCLVLFIVFACLRLPDFLNFFVSRQLRYATNVALSLIGILGIAIFVNIIVTHRFDMSIDMTKLQLNSLKPQTKKILSALDKKIHVTTYFSDEHRDTQRVKSLLALYQRETPYITVSNSNPYINIEVYEEKKIRDGTTVFETDDREEKVTIVDEQSFTSAILKLIRRKIKKVYFLVGHGEKRIDDLYNTGYSDVRTELEKHGYSVLSLDLLIAPDIPADCELLVIAGPKTSLKPKANRLIEKYLTNDGKLLVLFDPSTAAKDINQDLVRLMKKWGVTIGNDRVVDMTYYDIALGPIAPAPGFELHDITQQMNELIAIPNTRSITPTEERIPNLSVKSLAKTISPIGGSWGETAREKDGKFGTNSFTTGQDTPGPVSIAVAVEKEYDSNADLVNDGVPTRIVVFGSSQFAMNFFFRGANRVLFLSTVNWLTEDEDLIAIVQPDLKSQVLRRITVQEARLVQILSIFLIPLIVLIAGMIMWWVRREGGTV